MYTFIDVYVYRCIRLFGIDIHGDVIEDSLLCVSNSLNELIHGHNPRSRYTLLELFLWCVHG